MQSEAGGRPRFFVRINRYQAVAFGWEICRQVDSVEVHRSARLFDTRIEAILDSARAAAMVNIEPSSIDGADVNPRD